MPASTLKFFRQTHLYIGVFIAPALLFFAFTGALQTFSLHETTQGSNYKPPKWAMVLAQIHKKQSDVIPKRKPQTSVPASVAPGSQPAAAAPVEPRHPADRTSTAADVGSVPVIPQSPTNVPAQKSHLPLKMFFLFVTLGLFTSTLTGVYMAYKYNRNKVLVTGLLVAGVVIPLFLLRF